MSAVTIAKTRIWQLIIISLTYLNQCSESENHHKLHTIKIQFICHALLRKSGFIKDLDSCPCLRSGDNLRQDAGKISMFFSSRRPAPGAAGRCGSKHSLCTSFGQSGNGYRFHAAYARCDTQRRAFNAADRKHWQRSNLGFYLFAFSL